MSVLGKKPFITEFISLLNADQLSILLAALNTDNNGSTIYDLVSSGNPLPKTAPSEDADKIKLATLRFADNKTIKGVLMYLDTDNCAFVGYENNKTSLTLPVFSINPVSRTYAPIEEKLTAEELRRVVEDAAMSSGVIVPENVKFTVTNIKSLTDAQCKDLKAGDIIAKKTGNQYHTYVVSYNEKNHGLCLTYTDASVVETVSYDKVGGHWVYNSEDKTELGGGLPEVTAEDNGKVLEVIAGIWAKGGKKVNVIDANDIPQPITQEILDKYFKQGFFINGSYLGLINPIVFPCRQREGGGNYYGTMLTVNGYGGTVFYSYLINASLGVQIRDNLLTFDIPLNAISILGRKKPQVEVALTNLGVPTSTETAIGSNFYKNEIPYTGEIANEDVINVKMSNGAVYQAINDTANSKLVIYTGVDFASNSISVSKCWKLAY